MIQTALFSDDKKYRYILSRIWDKNKPNIMFIMLNPSTADSEKDDPTIRRIINFTKSWNYGGFYVVNLYAFCSTDPKGLKNTQDPIGKDNIFHVKILISKIEKVIYAWGNNEKEPQWLCDLVTTPYCIKISKNGIPTHPLYLKKELQPILYIRNRD
jgi:hypothetical protein